MAVTGAELYNKFNQRIDAAYTGFLDTVKANRMIRIAYINVIQQLYGTRLNEQNSYDQMSYLVGLNISHTPVANAVPHAPIPVQTVTNAGTTITVITEIPHNLTVGSTFTPQDIAGGTFNTALNGILDTVTIINSATSFQYVSGVAPTGAHTAGTGTISSTEGYNDYSHLLFATTVFTQPAFLTVSDITNTLPIRVTFTTRPPFRTRDYISISGVTGNTAANGSFYLKQLKEKVYALYSDINLQFGVAGNGIFGGTPVVSEIITAVVKDRKYDQKGNIYGSATPQNPKLQQGNLRFLIYPTNTTCNLITMDYIKKAPAEIDTANTTVDLERYYPLYFLDRLVDEAVKIFGFEVRDGNLVRGGSEMILENP
jgi:hypothetical protein